MITHGGACHAARCPSPGLIEMLAAPLIITLYRRRLHRNARDLVGTRKPARGGATSGCEQVTDQNVRTWAASGRDPYLALEAS